MKKALIGYGGHAKEVMSQIGEKMPCFVTDDFICENTIPLSKFNPKEYQVMIAIADPIKRENIIKKLPKETIFFSFIHPSSLIFDNVQIGYGSFIGAMSILTTNIKIGNHSILNRSNHIGHDTIIGDFFSGMPGAIVSGNCEIGNKIYLGTNSSIKEKIKICDNVIVGLNSGVVKNINECGVYAGVPASKIK